MNVERFIKKNIKAGLNTYLIKTNPGFKEDIRGVLSRCFLLEPHHELVEHDRGFEVKNLDLMSAVKILLRCPLVYDVMLKVGEYKYAYEDDFSHVDFKKLHALFEDTQNVYLVFKAYENVSTSALKEGFIKRFAGQKQLARTLLTSDEGVRLESYSDTRKHHFYISLTGSGANRRGLKTAFSGKATVREDVAANLLRLSSQLLPAKYSCDCVYIPFVGSGTFASEIILSSFTESIQAAYIDNEQESVLKLETEGFDFFHTGWQSWFVASKAFGISRSTAHLERLWQEKRGFAKAEKDSLPVICIDTDLEAVENAKKWLGTLTAHRKCFDAVKIDHGDVFEFAWKSNFKRGSTVFLPLNPPWGLRLNQNQSAQALYKNLCAMLTSMSKELNLYGFILTASKETFFVTKKRLEDAGFDVGVKHYTQGGKHVRAVLFSSFRMG